jgi:hypothetical protein
VYEFNKELFDALEVTRQGGEAPLFDQMFAGLDLHGTATVTGVTYGPVGTLSKVNGVDTLNHGSDHLRRSNILAANNLSIQSDLANGNYLAIAQTLNTLSTTSAAPLAPTAPSGPTNLQQLPKDPATGATVTNVSGRILRNGCDRLANGFANIGSGAGTALTNPLLTTPNRCFAENYISINPQMGNTTTYLASDGKSNYNSLQSQITIRPIQGVTYTATYAFAKALDLSTSTIADPLNYRHDYGLSGGDHKHEFRSNGSFELPIGPNKLVMGNSTGIVARLVERWQMNVIYNVTSGTPLTVSASTGMYNNFVPDVVGPFPFTGGKVNWNGPNGNGPNGVGTGTSSTGTYFGSPNVFTKVADPQCALGGPVDHYDPFGVNLVTTLAANDPARTVNNQCTLLALQDPNTGKVVLQQAKPGTLGNLGADTIRGVGNWSVDGNIGKTFRITESKSLQVRVDATNVFNHPTPANPSVALGGSTTDFGSITTKTGTRSFQGQVRFSF